MTLKPSQREHKTWEAEMASKLSSSKTKPFTLSLIFLSLALLLLTSILWLKPRHNNIRRLRNEWLEGPYRSAIDNPKWFDLIAEDIKGRNIKIGLVNFDEGVGENNELHGLAETIPVRFDRVADDRQWKDFFPEWIDEDEKWRRPSCPEIPMPMFKYYSELDVVVARVPCGRGVEKEGVRDVFRLQVNLVVANLVVINGWENRDVDRTVFVVFIGSCGPMLEIFRCDDLLRHDGDYWVYKPDLRRLKQKVLMPVGTCQLAPPYAEPGQEKWRPFISQPTVLSNLNNAIYHPREAYVTVLHSSEAYVCGAIALAQSIIQTNSTKDLVLLADDSISKKSLLGLKTAGWKIKHIERIRSPHAEKGAYNEWNYSKLRIWQLTEYDKVIFIDADLIVLKNIDQFFVYPQLSAVRNNKWLFNSGVMLVEPSKCMFKTLMKKRYTLASYNGGDQGFLNEVFTWWHRWPARLNVLKMFDGTQNSKHEIPENIYAMHYLGLKPWLCYRDYDCNWDMLDHHPFASDSAHRRWWQVYDAMPKRLQRHCALTKRIDARIRKWRGRAKNASLPDGHWKIKVMDPRQHHP